MRLTAWQTFALSLAAVLGTPSFSLITMPFLTLFLIPAFIAVYLPDFSFRLAGVAEIVDYPELAGALAIRLLALAVQVLYAAFAAGAIAAMVWGGVEKGGASLGEGIRKGVERCIAILSSSILFFIFVGLGFVALILPGILLVTLLFYFLPAAAIDGCGILDSFVRSFSLSRKNFGYTFLLALVVLVLVILIALVSYGTTLLFPDNPWIPALATGVLVTLLLFPLLVTMSTVGYVNVKT